MLASQNPNAKVRIRKMPILGIPVSFVVTLDSFPHKRHCKEHGFASIGTCSPGIVSVHRQHGPVVVKDGNPNIHRTPECFLLMT